MIETLPIKDQLVVLEKQVETLAELQRQLNEVKGKESELDEKALNAYLAKTVQKVITIQRSLDRGNVGLPEAELRRPVLAEKEIPEPKMTKTPYTE